MLVSKHSDFIQVVVIGRSAQKRVAFIGAAILAGLSDPALSQAQNRLLRDALRRIRISRCAHTPASILPCLVADHYGICSRHQWRGS
jgi:hypothetical protein